MKDRLRTMVVADVMKEWPQTVLVFICRRMACPGCPLSRFTTVREAAHEHAVDADELIRELVALINSGVDGYGEAANS